MYLLLPRYLLVVIITLVMSLESCCRPANHVLVFLIHISERYLMKVTVSAVSPQCQLTLRVRVELVHLNHIHRNIDFIILINYVFNFFFIYHCDMWSVVCSWIHIYICMYVYISLRSFYCWMTLSFCSQNDCCNRGSQKLLANNSFTTNNNKTSLNYRCTIIFLFFSQSDFRYC